MLFTSAWTQNAACPTTFALTTDHKYGGIRPFFEPVDGVGGIGFILRENLRRRSASFLFSWGLLRRVSPRNRFTAFRVSQSQLNS